MELPINPEDENWLIDEYKVERPEDPNDWLRR